MAAPDAGLTICPMSSNPELTQLSTAISGAAAHMIAGRFDAAAEILELAGVNEEPSDHTLSASVALLASYMNVLCATIGLTPHTFPDHNPTIDAEASEGSIGSHLWFASVCAARGRLEDADVELTELTHQPSNTVAASAVALLAGMTRWRADVLGVDADFLAGQLCLTLARL